MVEAKDHPFYRWGPLMQHRFVLPVLMICALAACGMLPKGEAKYPSGADRAATGNDIYKEPESIFGKGGMGLFGRSKESADETGIGVNEYLWRGALDTVSFMPLSSVDPFGGVILTDWYTNPETPNERIKLNVFVMDRKLSAEGVSVKVFRQTKGKGGWVDAQSAPETARRLEDEILTRARKLRVAAQGND